MLTSRTIKQVASLQRAKHRQALGLFVAEGDRLVRDLLGTPLRFGAIYHCDGWDPSGVPSQVERVGVTTQQMERLSGLASPAPVLAVIHTPSHRLPHPSALESIALALDEVQDPGNMGTILRLADWFGVRHLLCSGGTADAFAPKVVQASMGAIGRVQVHYTDLVGYMEQAQACGLPIVGTFLDGQPVSQLTPPAQGLVVLGNEGHGISPGVERLVGQRVTIPSHPPGAPTGQSLNVAMAASIVLWELRRAFH